MTVATRPDLVLGTAGATLEGTVITTTAGRGDLRLKARSDRALAVENELAATRCAATGHLDRQERPRGRDLHPKPLPGMRLTLEKCALRPLGARTGRGRPANGGPWSAIAPALAPLAPSARPAQHETPRGGDLPPPLFPSSLASCLALRNRPPEGGRNPARGQLDVIGQPARSERGTGPLHGARSHGGQPFGVPPGCPQARGRDCSLPFFAVVWPVRA